MEKYLENILGFEIFDSEIFRNMVEKIKVISKYKIVIDFKFGFEYEMEIY